MNTNIKNAIQDLTAAEKFLLEALKKLNAERHLKSVDLHCKIIDIREIIEILKDEE